MNHSSSGSLSLYRAIIGFVNFLLAWWDTLELFLWGLINHVPEGPVAYCRIATP